MTELEKKLLLSKEEYEYLMERFVYDNPLISKPIIRQINYYFDTDELSINQQNITCRIRLKDGKYKGIMKRHLPNSEQSTETEMEIYDGLEKNSFTEMGLKLQGELITERCVIFRDINCEVVLDKNEYLGYTDYELEVEYTPNHENDAQAILRIFRDMLIRRKCFMLYKESYTKSPIVPSKSSRFFERKSACNKIANDNIDMFNYSDPDDYMSDYYYNGIREHDKK